MSMTTKPPLTSPATMPIPQPLRENKSSNSLGVAMCSWKGFHSMAAALLLSALIGMGDRPASASRLASIKTGFLGEGLESIVISFLSVNSGLTAVVYEGLQVLDCGIVGSCGNSLALNVERGGIIGIWRKAKKQACAYAFSLLQGIA